MGRFPGRGGQLWEFFVCEFKYLSPLEDERKIIKKIQEEASILGKQHNNDITECLMKIHWAKIYIGNTL